VAIDIAKSLYEQAGSPETFIKVLEHYNLWEGETKYKVICPFHADINASLLIDVNECRWFCFGCQRGGGVLELIQMFNPNLSPIEQWQKLFRLTTSEPEPNGSASYKPKTKQQRSREQKKLLVRAEDYYYNLRKVNWLVEDSVEKQYLIERGFNPGSLNKAGAKLTYNDSYPIIFPMRDMGEFKGWICRTTSPEIEQKRKYLYNKGFSRRNTIVGKYDNYRVVVVEGYMDYLKAKQLGIKYVCAILGWKATQEQIEKLKKQGVTTIISALDNDECGKKGTAFLKQHFEVVPFQYPRGVKDMGDMTPKLLKAAKRKTMGGF
jgi:DNA primase